MFLELLSSGHFFSIPTNTASFHNNFSTIHNTLDSRRSYLHITLSVGTKASSLKGKSPTTTALLTTLKQQYQCCFKIWLHCTSPVLFFLTETLPFNHVDSIIPESLVLFHSTVSYSTVPFCHLFLGGLVSLVLCFLGSVFHLLFCLRKKLRHEIG